METKQVIVVRKDLKMNPGKLAAQVAHASMGAILSQGEVIEKKDASGQVAVREFRMDVMHQPALNHWLFLGSFTKVCVAVHSEAELLEIYERVRHVLPHALIKDSGRTVFKEPTYTCLAIGPATIESVDKFTGDLKLY